MNFGSDRGLSSATTEYSSRRRSMRLPMHLAVFISGVNRQARDFQERVETLEVSKYGARVQMTDELKVGTMLQLRRADSESAAKMRVAFQNPPDPATGKRDTGIEFVGLDGFWGISFPPDKSFWT